MSQTAETSARFRAAESAGRAPKDRDASSLRTLLTPKQEEARQLLKKGARHTLLWGGSRCVAGDTVIDGQAETIAELAAKGEPVRVRTSHGWQWAEAPFLKGHAPLLRFAMASGRVVEVTAGHRFWNGRKWLAAETFRPGDLVAVCPLACRAARNPPVTSSASRAERTSGQILPATNPASCPAASLASDPRSSRKAPDCPDGCSTCRRLGDARPLREEEAARACHASRPGSVARSPSCPPAAPFESGSRRARPSPPGPGRSRPCPPSSHPSSSDVFPSTFRHELWSSLDDVRTCAPSHGTLLDEWQSPGPSSLLQSSSRQADSSRGLSVHVLRRPVAPDTPCRDGYVLDVIVSITPTAKQAFYTLHVPGCEHYFANGVLHHNSGKTFLLVCTILARAARCPGSRHVILRYRYAHVRRSVWLDTLPKAAAAMRIKVEDRVQDGYVLVHCMEDYGGGTSQIFLGGLDDRNRTEKILGQEFSSVYFNECSQIDYSAVLMALTRLAQNCGLKLRAYYDCNPPDRGHWTYRLWFDHFDPMGRRPLADPSHYACMRINPSDNPKLDEAYLDILRSQPESFQRRFLHGEFSTTDDSALWPIAVIERQRCAAEDVPPMRRVVVGVDPSGASGPEDKRSDETGIVVCGRGRDGKAYVLADRSTRASPEAWAAAAVRAYHEFKADEIVAERNFGGEMVRRVIQVADPNVPVRMVTASRGKAIRAEPVAHLFATERAWLVGDFPDLEDQMRSFVPSGYNGVKSPDRADGMIHAVSALMLTFSDQGYGMVLPVALPPQGGGSSSGESWESELLPRDNSLR